MDTQEYPPRRGPLLATILVVGIVLLVICAIGISGLVSSQRASNERNASTSLKTLTSAEADFRANDRDWNHVNDFWTADVKGLYTMTSAAIPGARGEKTDPSLKLIELSIAAADADDTFYSAGGENVPLSTFVVPIAKAGFWYVALLTDLSETAKSDRIYKTDTGGTPNMGKVHHLGKFAFAAIPDSLWKGKYVFRVNENNTIFRSATSGSARTGSLVPPGLQAIPDTYLHFPDDSSLKSYWSLVE